jgi:hypothetical protein
MAMSFRRTGLALGCLLLLTPPARSAPGPADGLFQLVPPDVSATLAIEDLRDRAREFLATPLADRLDRLPEFRAWRESDRFGRFDQARQRLENVLGEKLTTIRDEIFGDAVVLSLRVAPDGRPEEARGLLLSRVRSRPLLDRIFRELNAAQTRSGEVVRVNRLSRSGVTYWAREFRAGSGKPTEYLTILDDQTLAWGNAEDLVEGVIDRRVGKARSLADDPRFQRVRRRLPARATFSLFLDPAFLSQRLAASAGAQKPRRDAIAGLVDRYLGAMEYAGAALQWRDGIVLHTEETLDRRKVDRWILRWAAQPGAVTPGLRRVPESTLAMASLHVDFSALLDLMRQIAPDPAHPRLDNLIVALEGILLGHDLQEEVLPQVGPGVIAYVEAPKAGPEPRTEPLSKLLVIGIGNASGLAAALENALRTYLAFYALDPHHGDGRLRLESQVISGRKITALHPSTPLAFAIDGDRLILGSTADAVVRAIAGAPAPGAGPGAFERLRTSRFPDAGSFACVDLVRLQQDLLTNRDRLAARLAARHETSAPAAQRDLDQAIALMTLFGQAYVTTAIEPDASAVHRSAGLIPRDPAIAPAAADAP